MRSPHVARAMREVPREEFMGEFAYSDAPLPNAEGQTISQPYIVAYMTEALDLERAIGVIYRPQTELASHYFQAVLPRKFDGYCWLDRTSAVRTLDAERLAGMPETYPFGV